MFRKPPVVVALICALGCGGSRISPSPAVSPATAPDEPAPVSDPSAVGRRHEVRGATPVQHRLNAETAADEAILEELAAARPAGDDDVTGDAGALPAEVSWDIDVDTYSDHDRVQYYLDFFTTKGRERMGVWLGRMTQYEAMIRERLRQEDLPEDLIYLALIESGFSNIATSRAKAVGMWQFMKGTAREYDLRIDGWVDERRDPFLATDAAARHLRDLTRRFGSVYLAAAAYNAGAGRVSRGLNRLPEDEDGEALTSDATFFRLYHSGFLHRETKDYVPKLIAAARIAKEPARYGIEVEPRPPIAYDSIVVPDMTGLDVIARLADTTLEAIREMNPRYLRHATPPGARSVIWVPAGRGASTRLAYAALPPKQRVTVIEHTIQRGETLTGIAKRYGASVDYVVQSNPKLKPRRLLPGQVVVIPTAGLRGGTLASRETRASSTKPSAKAKTKTKAAPQRTAAKREWHTVRRGETLSEIAEDYGVSVRKLRVWNALSSSRILAGQRLRVAPPRARAA